MNIYREACPRQVNVRCEHKCIDVLDKQFTRQHFTSKNYECTPEIKIEECDTYRCDIISGNDIRE
jgi:hypothetical protein